MVLFFFPPILPFIKSSESGQLGVSLLFALKLDSYQNCQDWNKLRDEHKLGVKEEQSNTPIVHLAIEATIIYTLMRLWQF